MAAILYRAFTHRRWTLAMQITLAFCGVFALAGLSLIAIRYQSYQYNYYMGSPHGRAWKFIHELYPYPARLRIAYTGTDINFGLAGPQMKNTIYHIPVTRWDVRIFHECTDILKQRGEYEVPDTDRIDFCRREPDYDKWLHRLKSKNTTILYVSILHQNDRPHLNHDRYGFPIERSWADNHPESFRPLYQVKSDPPNKKPVVRVYAVIY